LEKWQLRVWLVAVIVAMTQAGSAVCLSSIYLDRLFGELGIDTPVRGVVFLLPG